MAGWPRATWALWTSKGACTWRPLKDLIIRSGHNIDPEVIEDALGAHPAVQLCAAVGARRILRAGCVVYAALRPSR